MDGLWAMMIHSEEAGGKIGAGVLYTDGRGVWGGSESHVWVGTLTEDASGVHGELEVKRYNTGAPAMHPRLKNPSHFLVHFAGGSSEAERLFASVEVVDGPDDLKLSIELRRVW